MTGEPRLLTNKEFGQITLQKLEGDRAFMRDVHLTINESQQKEKFAIVDMMTNLTVRYESPDGKLSGVTSTVAFFVTNDQKHAYFFELDWPPNYETFLNPEDVIPSGFSGLNESGENKERVLGILKAEQATIEMVEMSLDDFGEFIMADREEDKAAQKSKGRKVRVPIDSMATLEGAIFGKDPRVYKLLGEGPIMFTKDLKRTDGEVVERYNHKLRTWERILGKPEFPARGMMQ